MRNFLPTALNIALLLVVVSICACAGGALIDTNDPLSPAPEPKETGAVIDPNTRIITLTKEDITVSSDHWSKHRLDRKYTTVDMRSPFFFVETWEQSFQSEVFYVTIANNRNRKIIFDFDKTVIKDDQKYVYKTTDMEFFKYKFATKKMMDLKTKTGLELAPQILLDMVLGGKNEIAPGQTVSGFLPFTVPNTRAKEVWIELYFEMEPYTATGAYEKIGFRFDYLHDPILRAKQTTLKR